VLSSNNYIFFKILCLLFQPCTTCCLTNRTHAFMALVQNSLHRETDWAGHETGFSRSPSLPSVDGTKKYEERDQAWLYSMIQKQFEIAPDWFAINTPYPINSTGVNSTNANLSTNQQSINKYWYFND